MDKSDLLPFPEDPKVPEPQLRPVGWIVIAFLAGCVALFSVLATDGCVSRARGQQAVFGPRAGNGEPLQKCTLIFLIGDLSKVLLQLPDNQVLLDTKEYSIEIQPGRTPVATCKLYRGVYRPSTPLTKTWEVGDIKFVESDVFQRLIDEAVEYASDDVFPKGTDEPLNRSKPPIMPTVPLNPNSPMLPANGSSSPGPQVEATKTKTAPTGKTKGE
jgi:hypothetical protein